MFDGKIHYKWPFLIAMLVHQRVPGLVKIQKAIEHGHRNSDVSHEKHGDFHIDFPYSYVNVYQRVTYK